MIEQPTSKSSTIPTRYDLIVFDLDGTLSDPMQDVSRSINYALKHYGYEERESSELAQYIGPPLDQTFHALTNSSQENVIRELVTKYRERYSEVGFSENILYPGVSEALLHLSESGVPMGVCTSKRKDFAEKILQMFGLSEFFQFVDAGDIGVEKWQQIAGLCEQGIVTPASIMIGDRAVDIIAAHKNGLQAAGVLWGYGSVAELESEHPEHLFTAPSEWSRLKGRSSTL
jgi:phosphoglycolate phosphatase